MESKIKKKHIVETDEINHKVQVNLKYLNSILFESANTFEQQLY